MTSTNFTIDNINPLIQYTPAAAWTEGSAAADPLASSYSNGTFTLCTTQGSSATFAFTGTQVFVFGAKRSNHGPYSVTLDGTSTLFDGFSANPAGVFSTLFASDVLPQGQHTVTVTNQLNNTALPFLDIDFITWTTTGADNGQSKPVEDTDPSFSYQPASSWTTDLGTSLLTGFSGNNGHVTLTAGASSTIAFSGDFITVMGPVGPTISRYTVQMDGKTVGTFNGTKAAYHPQVALYHADGLGAGPHSVTLMSQPAVAGQVFAIDFVQVSPTSTASVSGSGSAAGSKATQTGSVSGGTKSSSSVGPAVGAAIAGVLVVAILIFLWFFLRKRRRLRQPDNQPVLLEPKYPAASGPTGYNTMGNLTTNVPPSQMGAPTAYTAPSVYSTPSQYGTQNLQTQPVQPYYDGSQRGPPSQYHDSARGPPSPPLSDLSGDPYGGMASPPASNAPHPNPWGSSSHSGANNARRTFYTVNDDHSETMSSLDRSSKVHSSGAAGLGAAGNTLRNGKGAPLALPPTANAPVPAGASRMQVVGREQDFGPLPPDYAQATEPYYGG
ncbi:hypothetical protein C8F04DRAFT_1391271 [Mycena alexandri]|uniref:Transmembrane protein n=1 Tax=Mycena alexandri TaxID=1745969 RepID=A0AAD6T854_9AGAR|nr:hypothetical protein C8F04DRAFT_1391271 [Mycena alexandri]